MAEEHGFHSPEGHRLCANNCGFFGSPTTQNLCSKCYRDFRMKEEQAKSAKSAVENSLLALSSSSSAPLVHPCSPAESSSGPLDDGRVTVEEPAPQLPAAQQANRCVVCRKRLGLTGFRCRCGTTFCGSHRYPEQHGCTFDFKAMGREAIARREGQSNGQSTETGEDMIRWIGLVGIWGP